MQFRLAQTAAALLPRGRRGRPSPAARELVIPPLAPITDDMPRLPAVPGWPGRVDDGSPWGRYVPEAQA